jgi:hypothetical protein
MTLSRDAARRSIVLLNNRDNVLPLQKTGQKIALIGPFVQDRENIEGCWTLFGDKQRYVDLETGVRAAIGDEALLEIVPGCELEPRFRAAPKRPWLPRCAPTWWCWRWANRSATAAKRSRAWRSPCRRHSRRWPRPWR